MTNQSKRDSPGLLVRAVAKFLRLYCENCATITTASNEVLLVLVSKLTFISFWLFISQMINPRFMRQLI
jgi:hypothetical protein